MNSHIKSHEIETSEHACHKMNEIDNDKFTFYTCKFCEQTFTHLSAIMHHTLKSKFLKVKSHIFL